MSDSSPILQRLRSQHDKLLDQLMLGGPDPDLDRRLDELQERITDLEERAA